VSAQGPGPLVHES